MSDSPKILMEEMFRIAQQPASFTYKPAEGWTDPDITLHYNSVEEFDALCIGETVDGQPLYYGYTVEQIKQMSEWNLSASERHLIGKGAKDATAHLLGLVRYIRHKQEQTVKNYDPFWLVKLCYPDIWTSPGAPKLLVMPQSNKGRPKRDDIEMLKVYYFRFLFYPTVIYPILARQKDNPVKLVPFDRIKPMSYNVLAQVMNLGKTDLCKRVGESKQIAEEYAKLKENGVGDVLIPDAYRKMCDAAKAEMAKDSEWFNRAQSKLRKELGAEDYAEWLALDRRPPILGIDRDTCAQILSIIQPEVIKTLFSCEANLDYEDDSVAETIH